MCQALCWGLEIQSEQGTEGFIIIDVQADQLERGGEEGRSMTYGAERGVCIAAEQSWRI